MEELQLKNDNYTLYAPDSLMEGIKPALRELDNKLFEYCKLFNIDSFRHFNIYVFDSLEEFRAHIKSIRGQDAPQYAVGTYDNGDIHAFIDINKINKYMFAHEIFHIMYQELVWRKQNKPRVVWYDEGMAQMVCGQVYDNDEDYFKKLYINAKETTKKLPISINDINHKDNTFKTDEYNGYTLGYICVMYLRDFLSVDEFKEVLHNPDRVLELGKTVLNDAFSYYDKKYKLVEEKGDLRHAI